jgi:release factor glutamine methyltransferase
MAGTHSLEHALRTAQARGLSRLEAQQLLLHSLGRSAHERAWLLAHGDEPLTHEQALTFERLQARFLDHEPMAYLLGEQEFFGLVLQVDPRVLAPRPDTETLVEWALTLNLNPQGTSALDMGTGSGAIALALAQQRPGWRVHASDASADALAVARANGERLHTSVHWRHGSWWGAVPGERFDLVLSNPPYIADDDPHLAELQHEPRSALASGADGLDDIRAIVAGAPAHLQAGGWLLLEHGHEQASAVRALLHAQGFAAVDSRKDLAGIARCSGGRWDAAR